MAYPSFGPLVPVPSSFWSFGAVPNLPNRSVPFPDFSSMKLSTSTSLTLGDVSVHSDSNSTRHLETSGGQSFDNFSQHRAIIMDICLTKHTTYTTYTRLRNIIP